MKKLRWGVIGAGGIADRRTIPGMMLANNAELIAVMEINMELAEKSRAKWGCKRAYDSEAALLADPEIDAVYIASPVVLHAKQAMMAADAGKHILIEKPLAMTSEEGQKVVDYCESKGVKIAAGLMMRFGAYVMAMKQAIADGKIGRPVSGFSQYTCWYPDMPGNWRQSKKNGGGGAMMDMGVHCIDLMQYVTGSKVKQVAAFHAHRFRHGQDDPVPAGGGHRRQADARVPAGGFNDDGIRLQLSGGFRGVNHGPGDAVLHAAGGVEKFHLCHHRSRQAAGSGVVFHFDQRGGTNQIGYCLIHFHCCDLFPYEFSFAY